MRIVGIVQARMGSVRLPGKVLHRLAGRTVLDRVVCSIRASNAVDDIVVATTIEPVDDLIVAECERIGVATFRGPVDDVLARFLGALEEHDGDAVMRFTADNPLIDPQVIALAASVFRAVGDLDYLSTGITRTLPLGLDIEIISADALRKLDGIASDHHRVHVTSYVRAHVENYNILGLVPLPNRAHYRATLDTDADLQFIEAVIDKFGDVAIPWHTLVAWLDANPSVVEINSHMEQKPIEAA